MRIFSLPILIILLVLPLLHSVNSQSSLNQFKTQMEQRVKEIASAMTDIYNRGCDSQIVGCQRKSYNQCLGTGERACFKDLPTPQGCASQGTYLSNQSTISYPLNVDANNLSPQQTWLTCASAYLQESFVKSGQTTYAYQYIGTKTGSIRIYPSLRLTQENGECFDFDSRTRPWYVTAASGRKNVLIFIDTSGSMSVNGKLQIAKDATKAVIDTLSNNDFVGIVSFSGNAQEVNSRLERSTNSTKEKLKQEIQKLAAEGSTNYQAAFQAGFDLLQKSTQDQFGSLCEDSETILLFLTDGKPEASQNFQFLKNLINDLKKDKKIRLFTYGFGSDQQIDAELLRDLSCEFNGIMIRIKETQGSSHLVTAMENYYTVISQGVEVNNPIWTQPYIDKYGFGKLIGVSMPIYFTSTAGIKTLLGVASVDRSFSAVQKFGTEQEIVKQLISGLPCSNSKLSDCDLQAIRSDEAKCPDLTDCSSDKAESTFKCFTNSGLTTSDIFAQPKQDSEETCCGLTSSTIGIIVGSVIGGIVLIGIIIGVACYCKRRSQLQNNNQEGQNNRQQVSAKPFGAGYLQNEANPKSESYFRNNKNPYASNPQLDVRNPYEQNKEPPPPYIP